MYFSDFIFSQKKSTTIAKICPTRKEHEIIYDDIYLSFDKWIQ